MSLDRFYKQGGNRETAGGTLGAFWNRVFPDNGLVKAVVATTARSMGIAEILMREYPGWLTGRPKDVLRVDRLEVIPVDKVIPEVFTGNDGFLINSGVYFGAQAPTARWEVPLSTVYKDIPLIVPIGGKPLTNGVDYFHKGDKLFFRANPKALGIEPSIENINGGSTLAWSFLLAGCTPLVGTPKSNWSFYDIPESARRELMDILTLEATEERLLRFVQACIGVKGPSVFEKSDEIGKYTTLQTTWMEEGRLYGATSGGELITVPKGWTFENGFDADGNILRPGTQIAKGISIAREYSDGEGIGISTDEIFIPNLNADDAYWMTGAQVSSTWYGYIDPSGAMTARLEAALEAQGLSMSEVFPSVLVGNCIKIFHDALGRKQPSTVSLDEKSAAALANVPGAFRAVEDTVPAGSSLLFTQTVEKTEQVTVTVTDTVETFNALDYLDGADINVGVSSAVPAHSAL